MNVLFQTNEIVGNIPDSDWLRFGILLLILLTALQTVRLVTRVNRALLLVLFVVGGAGLFSSWVHNRNEPSFLTPVVDVVAPWFPAQLRYAEA